MPYGLSQAAQNLLAQVQSFFGAENVTVTSGLRSSSTNSGLAGASQTSQHLTGNAFDFQVNGYTPDQVQALIATSGIPFGQSIQEYGAAAGAGTNHLGVGTKGQLLTGNNGTYSTTNPNSLAAVYAKVTAGAQTTIGDSIKNTVGSLFGTSAGNAAGAASSAVGNALTAPADAINNAIGSPTTWFRQITIAVLAILLIGVALVMLSGKSPAQIVGSVPPVVP